jgi:hypothetical protein
LLDLPLELLDQLFAALQVGKFGLSAFEVSENVLDCVAVLALEPLNFGETAFDFLQASGIEVQEIGVVVKAAECFGDGHRSLLNLSGYVAQGSVELSNGQKVAGRLGKQVRRAGRVISSEGVAGGTQGFNDPLGVLQTGAFIAEGLLFARPQARVTYFCDLEPKEIFAVGTVTFCLAQRSEALQGFLELRP